MLLVLLTAEDCGLGSRKAIEVDSFEDRMFHELERSFVSEEMDKEHLQALEKRAIQKFYELVDYLNIYTDTSLDIQFRQQAKAMLGKTFISKTDLDAFYFLLKLEEDANSEILINPKGDLIRLNVDSVKMNREFSLSSDSNYEGELNFTINQQGAISQEKIQVVALKISKHFGSNSLEVWELFFKL